MLKKVYIFLIIAVLVVVAIFFGFFYFQQPQKLEVYFLDVGQGDAILIKSPFGQNILIDGGPDNTILKRLGAKLPWWERTIDLIVSTHAHDDHITGLNDVIKRYDVNKIIYSGATYSSPVYDSWFKAVRDNKIPIVIIDRPQTINLGTDCDLEILYPRHSLIGQGIADLNNASIVLLLKYKQTKFLFMGDAGSEVENELMQAKIDLSAEVIKISHHGSDTATSEEFLTAVKPQYAIIEVGNNDFGLPSLRIVKRLERSGANVYRTDEKGTTVVKSDGKKIGIETQR